MAILFRPAGFFLLVIYAISLAFVLWNRFGRRACLALAWPLPAIMLLLCCYNYATMGAFSPTAFGESQIGFATFTFWEQDPSYPANINDAIARTQAVMRKQVSDEGRALMKTSWDFSRLSPVYLGGFHYPALDQASTIDGKNDYFAAREWVQKISFDSIAKHPGFYLKMILTQLWLQYVNNPRYQEDFISFVRNRIDDLYVSDRFLPGKGQPFYVEMAKEWAVRPALPGFRVDREGDATEVVVRQTSLLRRLNRYVVFVRRTVFGNSLWTVLFAIALVVSTARLLRSRCRDVSAFIGFILTISVVGASLVVALVEYGAYRYSAVMEFVYYLPVLPLIFSSPDIRQAAHD